MRGYWSTNSSINFGISTLSSILSSTQQIKCCTWSSYFFTSCTFRNLYLFDCLITLSNKASLFSRVFSEAWLSICGFTLCYVCTHTSIWRQVFFLPQENTEAHLEPGLSVHIVYNHWRPKSSLLQGFNKKLLVTSREEQESWLQMHLKTTHLEEKQASTWHKKEGCNLSKIPVAWGVWTPGWRKSKDGSPKAAAHQEASARAHSSAQAKRGEKSQVAAHQIPGTQTIGKPRMMCELRSECRKAWGEIAPLWNPE